MPLFNEPFPLTNLTSLDVPVLSKLTTIIYLMISGYDHDLGSSDLIRSKCRRLESPNRDFIQWKFSMKIKNSIIPISTALYSKAQLEIQHFKNLKSKKAQHS